MTGKPDPERDFFVADAYTKGATMADLAADSRITTERVRQILNKAGVRKPKWTWSGPELVSKIYKLAEDGMSHSAIAREVGLSRERIRMIIKTGRKTT